jgi:transcription elongation factor Elf1
MTDEPVAEQPVEQPAEHEQPAAEGDLKVEATKVDKGPKVETVHCYHCGAPHELTEGDDTDWLCPHCEKYQDTMACPECGHPVRISLMDPAKVPAAHAPTRRKKGDE